jgi:hypothetical protein
MPPIVSTLNFVGTEDFGRSPQRIILGMVEAADEIGIKPDFWRKEFRVPDRVFVA